MGNPLLLVFPNLQHSQRAVYDFTDNAAAFPAQET